MEEALDRELPKYGHLLRETELTIGRDSTLPFWFLFLYQDAAGNKEKGSQPHPNKEMNQLSCLLSYRFFVLLVRELRSRNHKDMTHEPRQRNGEENYPAQNHRSSAHSGPLIWKQNIQLPAFVNYMYFLKLEFLYF